MAGHVLVVGARSKVGTELVPRLVAAGQSVRAATRRPEEYRATPGVEVVQFDYHTPESMKPALEGVDRVFMLSLWTDPHPELSVGRFMEHARTAGVGHVVFLSPVAVDPTPASKMSFMEKRLAGLGTGYTILRPNWLMQDLSHGFLLPCIRDLGAIVIPCGTGAISWVDARDVAEVAAAALLDPEPHHGQTHALTGGRALTFAEAADVLAAEAGHYVTYHPNTEDSEFRHFLSTYWEPDAIEYLLGLFAYVRAGDVAPVTDSVASLLGREPTTFEQFVRDNAAAWR